MFVIRKVLPRVVDINEWVPARLTTSREKQNTKLYLLHLDVSSEMAHGKIVGLNDEQSASFCGLLACVLLSNLTIT